MVTKSFELQLGSSKETEFIAITDQVKEKVAESNIKSGIALVFTKHSTSAIKISELDQEWFKDWLLWFEKIAPKDAEYAHNKKNPDGRPNTHAHIRSLLLNHGEAIPVREGKLLIGKWQDIFFVELDGPRPERTVIVQVSGE